MWPRNDILRCTTIGQRDSSPRDLLEVPGGRSAGDEDPAEPAAGYKVGDRGHQTELDDEEWAHVEPKGGKRGQ